MACIINKMAGYLAILALAILFTGAREAKADVITFEDVPVPAGGSQQISTDRYLSLGIRIGNGLTRSSNPFVISTSDAHTPTNIIWGGPVNPSLGERNQLDATFSIPGTTIPSATNFLSFYVIDNGDQQRPWTYQIGVRSGGETHYFYLKGSALFSFSSPLNDIWTFFIDFPDRNATSGIDTLTFNSPTNPVPEPATIFLLGTGLAGVARGVRRRHKAKRNE